MIMKRFSFFAVFASVAFASCTTNEVYEEIAKPQEIQFTAAPYSAQTRAEHDDYAFTGQR